MRKSALKKLSNYKAVGFETSESDSSSPKLVKIGEAANLLGISIDTLRRWEKKGWLKVTKTPGGTRLYDKDQLTKLNPNLKRGPKSLLTPLAPVQSQSQVSTTIPSVFHSSSSQQPKLSLRSDESILKISEYIKPNQIKADIINSFSQAESSTSDGNSLFSSNKALQFAKKNIQIALVVLFLTLPLLLISTYINNNQSLVANFNAKLQPVSNNSLVSTKNLMQKLTGIFSPTLSHALFGTYPTGSPPGIYARLNNKNLDQLASGRVSGDLKGSDFSRTQGSVLADSTPSGSFLQVNLDTQINGSLSVDTASVSGALYSATINTGFGDNEVYPMNQPLLTTSQVTFGGLSLGTLTLSAASNQLILGNTIISTQPTGSGAFTVSIPALTANGNFVIDNATQTLTNKTISGSSNTFTNIPNSALDSSSITINAGSGLSGGGAVSLGGSITLSATGSTGAVNSITGTTNQVIASASTGDITLSLPQDVALSSDPTFAGLNLTGSTSGTITLNANSVTTDYTFTFPSDDGSSGYVLQTDGSGNTSWVAQSGGGSTLQGAYDGGNTITTTTARNIIFNLAAGLGTSTSLALTNAGTATAFVLNDTNGATNTSIDIQSGGSSTLTITEAGTLSTSGNISTTGSGSITAAGTLTANGTFDANGQFDLGDGGDTGTISSTTLDIDATGALQVNSSGGAISIGNDAVAQAINIGTGAAARTITVGNGTSTTALALTSGTGDITLTSSDDILFRPSDLVDIGNGTDSIQFSNVGDITFVDANGGASITGPAGGALLITSNLTALNLQSDGSIDVNIAGGSGATGCTIANSSGDLTCSGALAGSNFSGSSSGTNTGDQNLFSSIVVPTQTTITANSTTTSLNVAAGSGVSLATDNTTKTLTISATGSGGDITAVGDVTSGAAFTNGGSGNSLYFNNNSNVGQLTATTLNSTLTWTLPDASGTICVSGSTCASSGTLGYWSRTGTTLSTSTASDSVTVDGTLTANGTFDANGQFDLGDGGDTGTISATTLDIDATGALQINSSGGAISIGNDAVAQAINIGTGAAARTITVGNATGATALALTSGTGAQTHSSSVVSGTTTSSAFVFNAPSLTTGTALYLSSSATSGKTVDINASQTSGTIFNLAYGSAKTLSGDLIGLSVDLNSGNVDATNQNVTVTNLKVPTATDTHTSGTNTLTGLLVNFGAGAGVNQNGVGGTLEYVAGDFYIPALTQTAGTLNAYGTRVVTPATITTGGTAYGQYISATGVGAGTLNGLGVSSITGGAGTEYALNIGTGWDAVLRVGSTTVINGSGITQVAGGGTGAASFTSNGVLYGNGASTLGVTAAGTTGQVLIGNTGSAPTWGTISGSSCSNCLVTDPSADQTIAPTGQGTTGLTVRQTSTASPTDDIFQITDSAGSTKYFWVDKDGNVSTAGTSAQTLTLTPLTDTTALTLVGTNVTTQPLQYINSNNEEGNILQLNYGAAQTLSTSTLLTAFDIDLSTNVTSTNASVMGTHITLPGATNTHTSGNKTVTGFSVDGGSLNQNGAGGTTIFTAFETTIPAITQTAGTMIAYGININTPSSITTGGTASGVNITATGVGAGTLNGINIGSITAGAGTENGLQIGSGWDTNLLFNDTTSRVALANGGTLTILDTAGNSLCTLTDSGSVGDLSCTGTISGGGSVGYWTRTGSTLTTSNASDNVTVDGTLTANGTFDANGQFDLGDGGDAGTISSTTLDIDATGALQINSSGGAISIGNDAVAQAINIGTGAAARTITVGNGTTTTALALTSGTGDITLTSADDIFFRATDLVDIGNGTDSVQFSNVGDITFVDANDGASITGPAGGALTISAATTALNLQSDGSINVNIAGGSSATGCTVANTTGNLTCSGNITGASTGTVGYWSRSGTTLSPATANDIVSIANTTTSGADLAITNTGVYTGTGIFNLTANSATTGTIASISGSGITNGSALTITGPGTTGITSGATDGFINITSDVGSGGTTGNLVYIAPDFSATSATIGRGLYVNAVDSSTGANADYGISSILALSNNAAKTGISSYGEVSSSSTTADSTIGVYGKNTVSAGFTNAAVRSSYGMIGELDLTAANSGSAVLHNAYGGLFLANSTGAHSAGILTLFGAQGIAGITSATSGSTNVVASLVAGGNDEVNTVAGTATLNYYGLLVENPSMNTTGTTTKYGVYIENLTTNPADTNYALYSLGGQSYHAGNFGIGGDTTPDSLLEVGDGTDELQVSSVGDITFVDANDAASITGPAGGALNIIASNSQNLALTTTTAGNISMDPAGAGDINIVAANGSNSFLNIAGLASGTVSNALCQDSSANVITCTSSSSAVSGTSGQIAFFNGTNTVTSETSGFSWDTTNKLFGIASNVGTTTGSGTGTGLLDFASTSLTTGTLLNLELTEGTLNGGHYLKAWDATAGASVFSIGEDGRTIIAGVAEGTTSVSLTAGDLVITDGDLSIAGGQINGATSTSIDMGVTTSGDILVTGDLSPATDDTYDLGDNTHRWKDLYLGGDTLHIGTSTTDEATLSYNTTTNIFNIGTDSTTNGDIAFFTNQLYLDKSTGNIGLGTTTPSSKLTIEQSTASTATNLDLNNAQNFGTSNAFASLRFQSYDTAGGGFTSAYDTGESGFGKWAFDSANGVLYATDVDQTMQVYRCAVSTSCDTSGDWSNYTVNTVGATRIGSIIYDSVNSALLTFQAETGSVIEVSRCLTSTSCDAGGDWSTYTLNTSGDQFDVLIPAILANGVLYISHLDNEISRCVLSSSCDAEGDWTNYAYTGGGHSIGTFVYDSANGVLYGGLNQLFGNTENVVRCVVSSGCDAGGDWATAYDSIGGADFTSSTIDTVNSVLYFVDISAGYVVRCATSTSCDASGDFTNYQLANGLTGITYVNGILYASAAANGIIYTCDISATSCDADTDWTTSLDTSETAYSDFGYDSTNNVLYTGSAPSGIIMRNALTFNASLTQYASIQSIITDSADTSEDGDLIFNTMRAGTLTEALRLTSTGSLGIGDSTPDALIDIDATTTTGNAFGITNTAFTTGEAIDITATFAPDDGSTQEGIDLNFTHTPTSSADTFRGIDLSLSEGSNALANTLYGIYSSTSNANNTSSGTHTIYGLYSTVTGKSAGTTTAIGVYSTVSGADSNFPFYSGVAFPSANSAGLCWDDSGESAIYDCASAPTDLAENFGTDDSSIEAGDLVVSSGNAEETTSFDAQGRQIKSSKAWINKSTGAYNQNILGVISTSPNQVYGDDDLFSPSENPRPVSLAGRVPVKVSTENGPIREGDYLTSSSTPGVAMKSTKPGMTIGRALSDFDGSGVGKVIVFVNTGYADPTEALANLLIGTNGQLLGTDLNMQKITVATTGTFGGLVSASNFALDAGLLNRSGALASVPVSGNNKVTISDAVNSLNTQINTLDSRLSTIDSNQASQSAQLADARILGEQAINHAQTLDDKVASTSANLSSLSSRIDDLLASISGETTNEGTESGELALTPPSELIATDSATFKDLDVTENLSTLNLDALDATISATFKSLGETFLGQTTIAGDLSIDGTMSFTNGDSINAFPTLFFQNNPLAQAVDFFNGKITLDKDGLFSTEALALGDQSVGTATIAAGQTEVTIPSSLITQNSKIFLTPESAITGNIYIGQKVEGSGFKVKLSNPNPNPVKFNWMIIQTKESGN